MTALLAGLALSTLVSEDLASIGAGLLAREGYFPLTHAVVACIVGVYVGDLGLWGMGRVLGGRALRVPWLSRALSSTNVSAVRDQIENRLGTDVRGDGRLGLEAAGVCRLVARCRCRVDTSARDRHRVRRRRSRHARGNRNPGWSAGGVGNGGHRARHDEASRSRSGLIDTALPQAPCPQVAASRAMTFGRSELQRTASERATPVQTRRLSIAITIGSSGFSLKRVRRREQSSAHHLETVTS